MTRCELNEIFIDSYVFSLFGSDLIQDSSEKNTFETHTYCISAYFMTLYWFHMVHYSIPNFRGWDNWKVAPSQCVTHASHMRHCAMTVPCLCHVHHEFRPIPTPLVLVVAKSRHGCRLCRRSVGSWISNLAFWSPFVQFTLQCDLKQTIKSQFKPPFTEHNRLTFVGLTDEIIQTA